MKRPRKVRGNIAIKMVGWVEKINVSAAYPTDKLLGFTTVLPNLHYQRIKRLSDKSHLLHHTPPKSPNFGGLLPANDSCSPQLLKFVGWVERSETQH